MALEEAFQSHLTNLPDFLGVPILLKPADYAQDLADAITFPGHQNPRHRRCKSIGYVSEEFKESEFDALPDDVGLQVDWAYDLLQKVKPEVRKAIEGATELHSADWRISRVPAEDKRRGVFQFVVFMYIDIGEAYTVRDKPKVVEPEPERIVVAKDYYKVCQACKNTDTKLLGVWDENFNAAVASGRWGNADSVRSCHHCGAKWCSDMFCDKPKDDEPQPERSTEQRQTDEELVQQIA